MTLRSIYFKIFAKILRKSCVFCCSSCISFNPTSYLNVNFFIRGLTPILRKQTSACSSTNRTLGKGVKYKNKDKNSQSRRSGNLIVNFEHI